MDIFKTKIDCNIPVPLSNVSAPRVFTSIYLKVITSYYAHILLIAMLLYFDRIIQDSKLTKKKNMYTYGPIFVFCTRFLMLPFLLNQVSFFVRWNIMKFCPGRQCPAMYEVMRSFGAIKTKKKRTYPLRLTRCFACAHFWSASTQSKHGVFARRFQRVRSEINIIEGALMTKRP